jgi:hypothetical protein
MRRTVYHFCEVAAVDCLHFLTTSTQVSAGIANVYRNTANTGGRFAPEMMDAARVQGVW